MLNRSEVNDGMEEVTFTRREGEQTIRFPGHVSERERERERGRRILGKMDQGLGPLVCLD